MNASAVRPCCYTEAPRAFVSLWSKDSIALEQEVDWQELSKTILACMRTMSKDASTANKKRLRNEEHEFKCGKVQAHTMLPWPFCAQTGTHPSATRVQGMPPLPWSQAVPRRVRHSH